MSPRAATIQIFLPGGDPRGIRIGEMTTRIVQFIEVPRSLLAEFLLMPGSGQVALYFLFGESEDATDPRVYIGQTGDLRARLTAHNKEKDLWGRAVVLISRTNTLTQTHALYLEWLCLQAAMNAARYEPENGTKGTRPHTPAPLEADCLEIFETGHVLIATLGYPVFDPVAKPNTGESFAQEVFSCKVLGVDARGLYTQEGFVVLAGSTGRRNAAKSFAGTSAASVRAALIESGVIRVEGDSLVFQQDHLFRSPSGAASTLFGGSVNGWDYWLDGSGRTLNQVKRQAPSA